MIKETGFDPDEAARTRMADMRFVGQGFEIVVELPPGPYLASSADALREAFEDCYRETFGRPPPDVEPEIINIRVSLVAEVPGGAGVGSAAGAGSDAEPKNTRPVYFPEAKDYVETAVYDRATLGPGAAFQGPAVIEEAESTLIVGPGATVAADENGNLIVDLPAEEG